MSKLDELHNALLKADAAGNVEDAKILADHIRSLSNKSSASTQSTKGAAGAEKTPSLSGTALRYSAGSGLANLADMIPNGLVNAANLGIAGYGAVKGALGSKDLPELIPSDALSGWSKIGKATGLINEDYAPTTSGGKIVDFTTQALTGGGINPAAIARNASRGMIKPVVRDLAAALSSGVGAGLGNVATQDINTGNTSLDNAIKVGGTLLGGATPSTIIAARGSAGDRAAAATNGVTKEQLSLADALAKKAAANGTPITGYEAIQSVTGLNPKMQTQQRIAEQSDAAAKNLTPMMQARPSSNAAAFGKTIDGIAPAEMFPDTLAGRLQTAAQKAIDDARGYGNALASRYYAKSSNDPNVKIPANDWNTLTSDPAIQAALKAVKNDPFSGLGKATEGSVQWLDAAKKWLDSQGQSKAQAGDRYAASTRSGAANKITGTVDPVIPEYAKARALIADNMQNNVIPMEQSQIGKLARSDDFATQAQELLPRKPLDVNQHVIDRTLNTIRTPADPDIGKQFLGQALRADFNESNQGVNAMGGSQFAKLVSDNPQQRQNLVQALQSSGADSGGLENLLDIFKAQGYKPPVNSATTANASELSAMGGRFFTHPLETIGMGVDSWRNGMAAKDLARALASGGDSVSDINNLARANGAYSPVKQQMLINLLNSTHNLPPIQ